MSRPSPEVPKVPKRKSSKQAAAVAIQTERDCIQAAFETGSISRKKAKELRDNIALMETELSY
jgi:hypothetical protein